MSKAPPSSPEPEPIEVEFEPAGNQAAAEAAARPHPARRSRSVTIYELIAACAFCILASVLAARVVAGAEMQPTSGAVLRDLQAIDSTQTQLTARADQASSEVVALRSRLESQIERISAMETADAELRTEIRELSGQISALIGAGDGAPVPGATSAASPLGALLARINKIENTIEDDAAAPTTTRQTQRVLRDLQDQVAALEDADTRMTASLNRRQAALAALEDGLSQLNGEFAALRQTQALSPAGDTPSALSADDRAVILAAAGQSRTIRALTALESAARSGRSFAGPHQALAALIPGDPDVEAMRETARRGAPTVAELRSDFERPAKRAARLAAEQNDGGWNWLRSSISGVVTVRTSDLESRAAELIRVARRALDAGDVRAALNAVDAIPGAPGKAFSDWRARAEVRARLETQMQSLSARLISEAMSEDAS
ncbi:MAG: hypothetical protein R3C52_07010 [Hyphomonadaceae bacterium]